MLTRPNIRRHALATVADGYVGGCLLPLVAEQILGRRGLATGRQGCFFQWTAFGGNSGPGSSREQQYHGECLHQQPRGIFIPGVVRPVCGSPFHRHRTSRFRTGRAENRHAFCRENGATRLRVAVAAAVNRRRDGVRNRGRSARSRRPEAFTDPVRQLPLFAVCLADTAYEGRMDSDHPADGGGKSRFAGNTLGPGRSARKSTLNRWLNT